MVVFGAIRKDAQASFKATHQGLNKSCIFVADLASLLSIIQEAIRILGGVQVCQIRPYGA